MPGRYRPVARPGSAAGRGHGELQNPGDAAIRCAGLEAPPAGGAGRRLCRAGHGRGGCPAFTGAAGQPEQQANQQRRQWLFPRSHRKSPCARQRARGAPQALNVTGAGHPDDIAQTTTSRRNMRQRGGNREKRRSRPVSRVLSWATIPLGASSPIRSSNLPGPDAGNVVGSLFGLAPGGVCRAGLLPGSRCALTAPFHPCHASRRTVRRYLSVALSVGSRRPGVTWHRALWSPDFPRHPGG